ncbi:Spo0E like sporulation regulatory protein [Aneurinibacillus soli]|uniref:Spo0E like sporulation regulatory protein n=1 Tax=Aneurinibacillus soli TaxID=1500254 RepID=A0A0U5BD02_9BACL|nr:Spo0E family sporulation regulatory protein-aspartic acid phosphatase [Aneurinibacillus soli]PYE58502.1 Spo0E like sporulation regulatory protein [Aneurinibacillus soli]BAU29478.1 Spo0E like sporulation regulatory protein [Aneurinibacillus soli]
METEHNLPDKIEELKHVLVLTATKHDFDFQNPRVLHLSRKLDTLILKSMRETYSS